MRKLRIENTNNTFVPNGSELHVDTGHRYSPPPGWIPMSVHQRPPYPPQHQHYSYNHHHHHHHAAAPGYHHHHHPYSYAPPPPHTRVRPSYPPPPTHAPSTFGHQCVHTGTPTTATNTHHPQKYSPSTMVSNRAIINDEELRKIEMASVNTLRTGNDETAVRVRPPPGPLEIAIAKRMGVAIRPSYPAVTENVDMEVVNKSAESDVTQPTASRDPPSESRIEIDQRDEHQDTRQGNKQEHSKKQSPVIQPNHPQKYPPSTLVVSNRVHRSFEKRIEDHLAYKKKHVNASWRGILHRYPPPPGWIPMSVHQRPPYPPQHQHYSYNNNHHHHQHAAAPGYHHHHPYSYAPNPTHRTPRQQAAGREKELPIVGKYRSIFESMNEEKLAWLEELDSLYDRVLNKPKSGFNSVVICCIGIGIELSEMNWYLRLHGKYNSVPFIGNTTDDLLLMRLKNDTRYAKRKTITMTKRDKNKATPLNIQDVLSAANIQNALAVTMNVFKHLGHANPEELVEKGRRKLSSQLRVVL